MGWRRLVVGRMYETDKHAHNDGVTGSGVFADSRVGVQGGLDGALLGMIGCTNIFLLAILDKGYSDKVLGLNGKLRTVPGNSSGVVSRCSGGRGGGAISTGETAAGHGGGLETSDLVEINSPPEMGSFGSWTTGPASEMSRGGVGSSGGQSVFSGSLTTGSSSAAGTGATADVIGSMNAGGGA
jgi:hypothetical protein